MVYLHERALHGRQRTHLIKRGSSGHSSKPISPTEVSAVRGYVLERESPEGRAICERSFTGIREYSPAPQWLWLNENPGTHPQRVDVDHCGVGLIDLFRTSTAGYRAGECAVHQIFA